MKIYIILISLIIISIFILIHSTLNQKKILLREKIEIKKLKLKINYTNKEILNKYFSLNKIKEANKKTNYKGKYSPFFGTVKLPRLEEIANYNSIITILHEHKRKYYIIYKLI